MTLGDILEEYVTLKEKKLFVERERCRLEQENLRVKNFLNGMHNVMTAYNAAGPNPVYTPSPQLLPPAVASGVRPQDSGGTNFGIAFLVELSWNSNVLVNSVFFLVWCRINGT